MRSGELGPGFFLLAATSLLLISIHASAQAGQLDASFASGGIFATTTTKSTANAVAIQSDGKIVVAGTGLLGDNFSDALIRLNTDGSLDTSFGTGGVANVPPPGGGNTFGFLALAIERDGRIVAAAANFASTGAIVQVARVETNGTLDTSFGSGGFTSSTAIPFVTSGALALQPDGKVVVAAGVMARFTATGQLDTTFGNGGIASLVNSTPTQIALQSNGRLLVASGEAARLVFQAQPAAQPGTISRYYSNGSLDTTFGSAGTVASVAAASALLLQPDGKIVVAGALTSKLNVPPTVNDVGFGIVRYSPNGAIDRTFGNGGVAIADFGVNAPVSGAFAVAIQTNGDLVAAGAASGKLVSNSVTSSFGLARFTSSGQLDTSFGKGGTVITTVASGQFSWITGLAIQSDGKIVAAGTSQFTFVFDNAYVARYLAQ